MSCVDLLMYTQDTMQRLHCTLVIETNALSFSTKSKFNTKI